MKKTCEDMVGGQLVCRFAGVPCYMIRGVEDCTIGGSDDVSSEASSAESEGERDSQVLKDVATT